MEANVVGGVGKRVETVRSTRLARRAPIEVRMLGPMTVNRDGVAVALPASRKIRALLAYLAVSPHPVSRTRLCELLWEVPNDPRGELRWSLSKLRRTLDDPARRRIETDGDAIRLDLTDCYVDVAEIDRAIQTGIETLDLERLRELSILFAGEFLDGLEIDHSPHFNAWLTAERRRFRARHIAVLEHLVRIASGEDVFVYLEKWLQLAPFDRNVHVTLLTELARRDRIVEGEEHLAATARLFEAEGLDHRPFREVWQTVRSRASATRTAPSAPSAPASVVAATENRIVAAPSRRASIAVMPFTDRTGRPGGYADGLAHDVITRLAKLRSVFVIAQGTVFALRERSVGSEEAGRTLNVDYVVTGSVQRLGKRLTVSVELAETRTARIAWAEVFDSTLDDAFLVLDEIGNRIVSSIATEVEAIERNRAILKPPSSLDAWEAHHRGLWHMYRFNKDDNARAQHFFEMAVRLDPTFARAHAGLSFTHWQNAFQNWAPREQEVVRALETAGQSLMADDRDPAAHWAMGRALWMHGHQDQSVVELETAVDLSPNFALAHYTLAFVKSQAGDARAAIESSDHSRHLSPFDPLLFAMLGARAMALVRLGEFQEAAHWAVKAAARPNAHAHITAIATYSLALAGRLEESRAHAAAIHKTRPRYGVEDFLSSFRFEPHAAALFRKSAKLVDNT